MSSMIGASFCSLRFCLACIRVTGLVLQLLEIWVGYEVSLVYHSMTACNTPRGILPDVMCCFLKHETSLLDRRKLFFF